MSGNDPGWWRRPLVPGSVTDAMPTAGEAGAKDG